MLLRNGFVMFVTMLAGGFCASCNPRTEAGSDRSIEVIQVLRQHVTTSLSSGSLTPSAADFVVEQMVSSDSHFTTEQAAAADIIKELTERGVSIDELGPALLRRKSKLSAEEEDRKAWTVIAEKCHASILEGRAKSGGRPD